MISALIPTIESISIDLLEQTKLFKEAGDRDDIFSIKRNILYKIRELEKQLSELRATLEKDIDIKFDN